MRVNVYYHKKLIGKVAEKDGKYYFKYEDEFINTGHELAPLMMPLSKSFNKVYDFNQLYFPTFYGLPGLIADSIPDKFGNNILDAWLNKRGKTLNELSTLERLAYLGNRAMGALEFEPDLKAITLSKSNISLNELSDMAQLITKEQYGAGVKTVDQDDLAELFEVGTSAGGARAKAVLGIHDKTEQIVNGQAALPEGFRHYIVKFDTITEKGKSSGVCLLEKSYYDMLRMLAIPMMPSKLIEENGRFHFATKRFDRSNTGEKIHTQTLCALGHYNYKDFESYSYENLFFVARSLNVSYQEREQLFKQMLFNVMAKNLDDHTKNFSFLYHNNKWKVAPAYDVSYNFDPKGLFTQLHKMSINGKNSQHMLSDLLKIAEENSINKPLLLIEEMKDVLSMFPKVASKYELDKKTIERIFSHFKLDLK
ncbi:MAG: type II toxin-antitoxin system HipA family toxin [Bacteroidetes bacterium]|nr:type II toxin-antitoxin system HipA family toxin [Bacteroidota bacterium]